MNIFSIFFIRKFKNQILERIVPAFIFHCFNICFPFENIESMVQIISTNKLEQTCDPITQKKLQICGTFPFSLWVCYILGFGASDGEDQWRSQDLKIGGPRDQK